MHIPAGGGLGMTNVACIVYDGAATADSPLSVRATVQMQVEIMVDLTRSLHTVESSRLSTNALIFA